MTHNADHDDLRDHQLAEARSRVRRLASQGLSAPEIEARLEETLTATERQIMRIVIRSEVDAARRNRAAVALEPGVWFRQHSGGHARRD